MFLTHPIASSGFSYSLIHLEVEKPDPSKVYVPFLEGNYALFMAWIQAQVVVAEEAVAAAPEAVESEATAPEIVSETVESEIVESEPVSETVEPEPEPEIVESEPETVSEIVPVRKRKAV